METDKVSSPFDIARKLSSRIFNKRVFVECYFRKPAIVCFKVQDLSKNVHNCLAISRSYSFENDGKTDTGQSHQNSVGHLILELG